MYQNPRSDDQPWQTLKISGHPKIEFELFKLILFLNNFGPMPLFIFFNIKTMRIKSITHNSIAMLSPKFIIWRESKPGLQFLRRMWCPLRYAARAANVFSKCNKNVFIIFRQCFALREGSQVVFFQTKNPNLGKNWRALQWKMLVNFICQLE
jgi:hypothetical protein